MKGVTHASGVYFVFRGTEPKEHKHKTEYNQHLHLGKLQFGATWKVEAWKLVVAVADADAAAEIAETCEKALL
jgi:hypothetical protein